ncbi:unnamed protein product [Prunus armeniaca]
MEKVKLHTPDMVMLLETKTRSSRYVFIKKVLGMPFMHAMEIYYYFFVIEVGIKDVEKGCVWRFFGVYASIDDPIRRNQWQALRTRILTCQEAVMVMEDFNDFLDRAEKQGGNSRSERSMLDFRSFVTDLSDLGFVGYPFTWRNRRLEEGIQERLDRGFADDNWLRF